MTSLRASALSGSDPASWPATTAVWTDPGAALSPATKAYAGLSGVGALLLTWLALLGVLSAGAYALGEDVRRFATAFTVVFAIAYASWFIGSWARLAAVTPAEQAKWPLLQRELFDVLHGGQVFFDFVDERLHMPDTPQLVIDVLFFCLSDGFAGKFRDDPSRLEQYKRQLSERIPHPTLPQVARKRRAKEEAESQPAPPPPIRAVWLYVSAAAVILVLFGLTALLTNL